jgi:hypothetical protein
VRIVSVLGSSSSSRSTSAIARRRARLAPWREVGEVHEQVGGSGIDGRERGLQGQPMPTTEGEAMSRITIGLSLAALVAVAATTLLLGAPASAAGSRVGVGFNAPAISGFPGDFSGGKVFLSGGGAYDPATASNTDPEQGVVHSNGGFHCLEDVRQGPLQGCLAGQGIRWDTDGLLESTRFKCTGSGDEAAKTAVTNEHTSVLLSDFYRAGDGDDASFKGVKVIVSDQDLDPELAGNQNVWIEQVGCSTANVNFSS